MNHIPLTDLAIFYQSSLRWIAGFSYDVMNDMATQIGLGLTIAGGLLMFLVSSSNGGKGDAIDGSDNPYIEEKSDEKESSDSKSKSLEEENELINEEKQKEAEREEAEQNKLIELFKQNDAENLKAKEALENGEKEGRKKGLDWSKSDRNNQDEYVDKADRLIAKKIVKEKEDKNQSQKKEKQKLHNVMDLMLSLIGRDMHDHQIIKSLYRKTQESEKLEDIVQTLAAVQSFIEVCRSGKLKELLGKDKNLPSKEEALSDLAYGKFEKAVLFLEKAMGIHLDKAEIMSEGPLKQSNYLEASNYSVAMGSLAMNFNGRLAFNAFKNSVEICPENPAGWGRLGDSFILMGRDGDAKAAYMKAINLADNNKDNTLIANADYGLAMISQREGDYDISKRFFRESEMIYADIGLYNAMSNDEVRAMEAIERRDRKDRIASIMNLLNSYDIDRADVI